MNSLNNLAALTGMPAGTPKPKAVRRGGGRHKAGPKGLTPQQHLANATSALKAGNHAAAKTSALHLANALHALSKPKGTPNAPTTSPGTAQGGQAGVPQGTYAPRSSQAGPTDDAGY